MSVDAKYKTTATAAVVAATERLRSPTVRYPSTSSFRRSWEDLAAMGPIPRSSLRWAIPAASSRLCAPHRPRTKIKRPEGSTVTATIGVGPRSEGGFGITAELDVYLPDLPEADARKLVEATHEICSYSNAIKASVDVKTRTRS